MMLPKIGDGKKSLPINAGKHWLAKLKKQAFLFIPFYQKREERLKKALQIKLTKTTSVILRNEANTATCQTFELCFAGQIGRRSRHLFPPAR